MEQERVHLRRATLRDASGFLELLTDPDVRVYLGGTRSRTIAYGMVLAGLVRNCVSPQPYNFVAADVNDQLLGTVQISRRSASRPGHIRPEGGELELSYVFRRQAWGRGLATEAARLALVEVTRTHRPDEPVVVVTQEGNAASLRLARRLGFVEVMRFNEFNARQVLAVARLSTAAGA